MMTPPAPPLAAELPEAPPEPPTPLLSESSDPQALNVAMKGTSKEKKVWRISIR